jgi:hypothetical protein
MSTTADPWRYECPECGASSSRVHRRTTPRSVEVTTDGEGLTPYYCNGCSQPVDGLHDKKEDTLVKTRRNHE